MDDDPFMSEDAQFMLGMIVCGLVGGFIGTLLALWVGGGFCT